MADRIDRMSQLKTRDQVVDVDEVINKYRSPGDRWRDEVRLRAKQHSELVSALAIHNESVILGIREQTNAIQEGLDALAESNQEIANAIDRWGAETTLRLDTINSSLVAIGSALDKAVSALQRPNETASREKWEDAREAWLDKRYARARQLYNEALALYDALSPASFQLGNLLLTEFKDLPAAMEAFTLTTETATRRLPALAALAHYNMHLVYRSTGDWPAAKASLEQATELQPTMVPAWWDLAVVSARLDDVASMVRALTAAIELDPLIWHKAKAVDDWNGHQTAIEDCLTAIYDAKASRFSSQLSRLQHAVDQVVGMLKLLPGYAMNEISRGLPNIRVVSRFERGNLLHLIEGEAYFQNLRSAYIGAFRAGIDAALKHQAARIERIKERHEQERRSSEDNPATYVWVGFVLIGGLAVLVGFGFLFYVDWSTKLKILLGILVWAGISGFWFYREIRNEAYEESVVKTALSAEQDVINQLTDADRLAARLEYSPS